MKSQHKQTASRRNASARRATPVVPLAVTARRVTLAVGIALLSSTALTGPALGAPVTWVGTTGFWDVGGNWNPGIPAAADQVTINVAGTQTVTHRTGTSNINSLNNAETLVINNGSTLNVNSGVSTNTGTIQAGGASAGTFNLNSLTLTNTGGTVTAADSGVINQSASTIIGGTVGTTGTGIFRPSNSASNFLDGVTVSGTLDMATALAVERVINDLTLNGTININQNSALTFQADNTISGTGSIVLGATGASNRIALDGNGTTTLGAGITIRGQNGTIGNNVYVSGTQALVNDGAISADVAGGTITITGAAVTNNGILEARNGGTLVLNSDVTGTASGQILAGTGSVVSQSGVTLSGTINTSGGGNLRPTNSASNYLDGVTFSGTLDMATALAVERVINHLTLNGTININQNSALTFEADNTISGTGSIVFGNTGASNRIALDANGTTTLGAGITIRGQNGTIGNNLYVTGTQTLVNNGTISADVAGGTISIGGATVTNNGILEAKNGGTLVLSSNVTGNPGSQILAGTGSVVSQNGVTLSGTINTSGGGSLRPTNSSSNFLDGVIFSGTLDMATANAVERVINDLTLNGTINVNANSILAFQADNTISGTGAIVLGATGASNRIALDGNGTTTLGAGITIRGQNGTIGNTTYVSGTQTLVNNGKISADVSGGTITITESAVTNGGLLEARNGGTLVLNSDVTGTASGQIVAETGSVVQQNGVTISGTVNVSGGGSFRPANSSSNFLDNVTFGGTLDMATALAVERVVNNLTLNGAINVNANSILAFQGDNTISGMGSINLGATGPSNRIALDGTGTTTLGAGITIRGENGTIGNTTYVSGTQVLVNNGTISADVSGGTIRITESAVINNNVLEARNGGTLVLDSQVTGGTIHAADNGIVSQTGATIIGSTITSATGGVFRPTNSSANFLDGVTVNGTVDMATANAVERVINDLTLNGAINVNANSILAFQADNTISGTGSINLGATGSANRIALDGTGTTTVGAGITIRGQNGTIGNGVYASGTQVLVNNGTISADVAGGTIALTQSAVTNNGLLQAKNGGTLSIGVATNNQGTVEALANSAVTYTATNTTQNITGGAGGTGGTLTGGLWRADAVGGANATITLRGNHVTTNAADVYLVGPGSLIQVINNLSQTQSLDNTLSTNNGSLRVHEGRSFTAVANSGNFTNNGLLELASGGATSTFKANTSLTNSATGTIAGYGTVDNRVANDGTIVAQLGTLTVDGGMTGNGTARADGPAAVLNLSQATAPSFAANLDLANGGSLNLGSQNFVVSRDYTNSSFGVGNAFNARASVSGTGQIQGQGTQQAITGDVVNGTASVVTLDLGNVRGGTSVTRNYQVANTGTPTAADLRGAVQTSFTGGGVTDARLSGSGVAAQNFGPITGGANSGNLAVTFNATAGGSLAGQSIRIANNFDDVADQTINFTGNASALAVGNATPGGPINLGNFRVGGTPPAATSFSVANSTSGAGAERLGISSVTTAGNYTANNVLGTGLINGGASQAGAVTAQLSGGTAGANNGAVTINYRSDGTLIDPTFTSQAANSQTINFTATGYNLAAATLGSLNFGTVAVGSAPIERFLTVSNSALPGLFSEDLKAQLGLITGPTSGQFSTSGSGVINNLIAGANDSTTLKVTLTPTAAGVIAAQVAVELFSTGTVGGVSNGLGEFRLPDGTVPLLGTIDAGGLAFNLAQGSATPTARNFGNLRVGDAATQAITVSNIAPVDPLTEGLNASASVFSGTGITASGAIGGLAAGTGNASAIAVGLDTSSAGAKSGTARVAFVSDGSINAGGATTPVGQQDIAVQGNVFRLAEASVTPDPVVIAAQRIGGTNSAAVTIANTATADGFSEGLRASGNGSTGAANLSGPASVLVAAGANSTAYGVSVDTATAGAKSGTVSFALASDGTGTSGIAGNVALPGRTLDVQGNVYAAAQTDLTTESVNFGTVRKGTVLAAQNIAVANTAAVQGLNDSLVVTSITGPASPFGASAGASLNSGVAPGVGGTLSATMSTATAGVFGSLAQVNFASRNAEMADLSLGAKQVDFSGTVNEIATAAFSKAAGAGALTGSTLSYTLDFGTLVQGSSVTAATLRLLNDIPTGPADSLIGSFDVSGAAAPFQLTGFGAIPELAASSFFDMLVDIDTSVLGSFLGTILFNGASHNAFQTDLTLAPISISLRAVIVTDVPPPPPSDVPEPASGALMGLGAGALWWLRRRRAAAAEK
jgi:hypothetical protein